MVAWFYLVNNTPAQANIANKMTLLYFHILYLMLCANKDPKMIYMNTYLTRVGGDRFYGGLLIFVSIVGLQVALENVAELFRDFIVKCITF